MDRLTLLATQKLDLPSLRQRAFQHIVSQLTPQNIPYEVFSQFSATYEEVRKVPTFALSILHCPAHLRYVLNAGGGCVLIEALE